MILTNDNNDDNEDKSSTTYAPEKTQAKTAGIGRPQS